MSNTDALLKIEPTKKKKKKMMMMEEY